MRSYISFTTIHSIISYHLFHRAHRDKEEDDSEEEEDEEEGSEEEEESEEEESGEEQPELTRAQRREMKKKQVQAKQAAKQPQQDGIDEDDEDADLINPNHVQKKLTISDLNEPRQLSRRERCVRPSTSCLSGDLIFRFREQKEKKEAEERYWKVRCRYRCAHDHLWLMRFLQLHLQGKTDKAKADLQRLAKIRAEREAAAAKRQAESEGLSSNIFLLRGA